MRGKKTSEGGKMIIQRQIDELLKFDGHSFPVTTLYLDVDRKKYAQREYEVILRNLIREQAQTITDAHFNRDQITSLQEDLAKIERYVTGEFNTPSFRGLCVFSSSGNNFWQVYGLPRLLKSYLIIGHTPYLRPLSTLMSEYRRYCTLLVDRRGARLFEVYMEEIIEHQRIFDEVPGKTKPGGWYGLQEKRIRRHLENEVHKHFKNLAQTTLGIFKRDHFDWLILGGKKEDLGDFESMLHSYLKERIVDRTNLTPDVPLHKVLEATLQIEELVETEEETKLVKRLLSEEASGGLAITGLEKSLDSFRLGAVQTFLVMDELSIPGFNCSNCKFFSTKETVCPYCGSETTSIPDIIEQVTEDAIHQGGQVKFILRSGELQSVGSIGAFLRFKV